MRHLKSAGFEAVEMHGWTSFMTSPKTRGALFSARRPRAGGAGAKEDGVHLVHNGHMLPAGEQKEACL